MQMEAKAAGFDNGVFIDDLGFVGESSNMNVAFVTQDGVLRHPKFERVLPGCTSLRVLSSLRAWSGRGVLTGVEVADIPAAEARKRAEMLLLGSSVKVAPIVAWDEKPIGDGKPGPAAAALLALIDEDMRSGDRLIGRAVSIVLGTWCLGSWSVVRSQSVLGGPKSPTSLSGVSMNIGMPCRGRSVMSGHGSPCDQARDAGRYRCASAATRGALPSARTDCRCTGAVRRRTARKANLGRSALRSG
jgi:hypothetical protein